MRHGTSFDMRVGLLKFHGQLMDNYEREQYKLTIYDLINAVIYIWVDWDTNGILMVLVIWDNLWRLL